MRDGPSDGPSCQSRTRSLSRGSGDSGSGRLQPDPRDRQPPSMFIRPTGMRSLSFDVRDALRGLRRDRAYTLTVVVTLALTIGATTAVFSIVDGVLLKPLAYHESQRLVSIRERWRQFA